MKIIGYISCLIFFAGCAGDAKKHIADSIVKAPVAKSPSANNTFKPYVLTGDYMVTDTGYFDFEIGDGVYAVVKRNDRLVDTIDKAYGFHPVDDDTYMYCVIDGNGPLKEKNTQYKTSISANIGSFIIINSDKKIDVSNTAPDLGWFANPSIINHRVYYWQVKKAGDDNKIFAAEFDPKTSLTTSHYLFNDYIETDDGGYFATPYLKNDTIYFEGNKGKTIKFTKDFKTYN